MARVVRASVAAVGVVFSAPASLSVGVEEAHSRV
jgi:hypothetical protein